MTDEEFTKNYKIIDIEFDTFAEKMAFYKGLFFEGKEKLEVFDIAGCFDDRKNKAGKYEWSIGCCPKEVEDPQ